MKIALAAPELRIENPPLWALTSACRREMWRSGSGSAMVLVSERPIVPPFRSKQPTIACESG